MIKKMDKLLQNGRMDLGFLVLLELIFNFMGLITGRQRARVTLT